MARSPFWAFLWRNLWNRDSAETDLDAELEAYFETLVERHIAQGLSTEEARRVVRLKFEDPGQVKEKVRDARIGATFETTFQDLRYAFRTLRKSPAFALTAIISLALAIGANTAIFSVVESVLLRSLPYKDPSRLVRIWNTYPPLIPQGSNSAGDFRDFQSQARSFSAMGAYIDTPRGMNLTGAGDPVRLDVGYATSGLFPMLGIDPVAGRSFSAEEDNPGSPPAVLISHRLWQNLFASDPGVVGRTLTLDGRGYLLAGVLPEALRLSPSTDVWIPIGQYNSGPDPYRYHEFNIIGRLKPGVLLDQAQTELTVLNRQEQQARPVTHKNFGVLAERLEDPSAARMRTALLILFAVVGLVLLVACANFINLLMARNAARQSELALRAALGASGARLLSQVLAESVLLALAGGILGIFLAQAGLLIIGAWAPSDLAGVRETGLNFAVLMFTLAVSLVSGVACGLIPAFQSRKADVHLALKQGARATGAAAGQRVRRLLVVFEIALAVIPLVGAGLLMRSLHRILEVDPGFQPDHILAMEVDRPPLSAAEQSRMSNEQRIAWLRQQSLDYDRLIDRIQALPGVQAAGGITVLPLGSAMRSASRFVVEGQSIPADGARPVAQTRGVSAGYLAAMGIPLRAGRLLDAHDYASQNVLVNETLAKKFWRDGDAVGKRIDFCSLAPTPCWVTIVGVVGNVHQYGLEAAPTFDEYGTGGWLPYTVIRSASDPAVLEKVVLAEVHRFDPTLPVTHVMTLDNLVSDSVAARRFSTVLLGLFAGLALLLALIGVYAIISYTVRLRTSEIGVRMALGAQPGNIWWLIVGGGARLVLAGIAIGLAGSFVLTKLIASLLYGVTATDPVTFGAVAALLTIAAGIACYVPARKAMRMDPLSALRRE